MTRHKVPVSLSALVLLAALLTGCTTNPAPIRIGVLSDCVGFFRNLQDAALIGAEVPLLERGAALRGQLPSEGLTPGAVAGHPIELVTGCTEGGEYSTLIDQTRVLIEVQHADVVIGGSWAGDGLVLREVARKYPNTLFVVASPGARQVTLGNTAPNLFRFAPDLAQQVAGLGTYVFQDLGWRRAVVIADNNEAGWDGAAAFLAEFCALGGQVTQYPISPDQPSESNADADGVALFSTSFGVPAESLTMFAADPASPATSLVLGPGVSEDLAYLRAIPEDAAGVVTVVPAPGSPETVERYRAAVIKYFPSAPRSDILTPFVVRYHDAVMAVMLALEQTSGTAGAGLAQALGSLDADLVAGRVRLDANRAALLSTAVARLGGHGAVDIVRTVPDVDQTFGGALPADYAPRAGEQPCIAGTPPPWAK
jgi:branched-chain amino acid transport system substrate-binding protein